MRRLTLVASLCLLGLVGATTVFAEPQVWQHKATLTLSFRTTGLFATLAARDGKAQRLGGTIGYIDSTTFQNNGKGVIVTTTGGTADTTAPVPMSWLYHPSPGVTALGDTASYARFNIVNAGNSPAIATLDSLYLIPQVSSDGNYWHTPSMVAGGVESVNPFTAASTVVTSIPLLLLVGPEGTCLFKEGVSGRTACDLPSMWSWPFVRFIVLNDISAAATTIHNFKASLSIFSASEFQNK